MAAISHLTGLILICFFVSKDKNQRLDVKKSEMGSKGFARLTAISFAREKLAWFGERL